MQNVLQRAIPRDRMNEKGIEREDAGGHSTQVREITLVVFLFVSIVYLFNSWWNHVCRSV